jgi:hypothetical protein
LTEYKKIEYEDQDIDITINNLTEAKVCPFYYYMSLIKSNPNIVISTYKDFFDPGSRIRVGSLVNIQEYQVILDDCDDLDNNLTNLFSANIDVNVLQNSMNQVFTLREMIGNSDKKVTSLNYTEETRAYNTENEFILYNGLSNATSSESSGKGFDLT